MKSPTKTPLAALDVWQIAGFFSFLFLAFNLWFVIVQPLDRPEFTLYNHPFPGRSRFFWTQADMPALGMNELGFARLFNDHKIAQPKAADEYRVIFLGGSETWGFGNEIPSTVPELITSMQLTTDERKHVEAYNIAYVYPDILKDLVTIEYAQANGYQPDLAVINISSMSFDPNLKVHWLLRDNLVPAKSIITKYGIHSAIKIPKEKPKTIWELTPFAQRQQIVEWMINQIYAPMFALTGVDTKISSEHEDKWAAADLEKLPAKWTNTRADVLAAIRKYTIDTGLPIILVNVPQYAINADYQNWLVKSAQEYQIPLLDCSTRVDHQLFTNSATHLDDDGQSILADETSTFLQQFLGKEFSDKGLCEQMLNR